MKTRNWIIVIALAVCLVLGLLSFRPVPTPDEKACVNVAGVVTEIYQSGTKDISFKLEGQDQVFYINRGVEKGLDLEKLKTDLTGKQITIKFPDYWTPLDPSNSIRHISKLEHQGVTIFSELE